MSGITSGIGLISGINTADLINQLMALEARPVQSLQRRVQEIDTRRAAFMELSAQLLAIKNAVSNFHRDTFFRRFSATSSNESVLLASASEDAIPGSATIRVHSLVSNHSVVSRGFADANRTPIGLGTITLEGAAGRVNRATELDALNGGSGVRRGIIRITDRSGASADIDLQRALTVADVIDAINDQSTISVRASTTGLDANGANGERIVLEDTSGGSGNLIVSDVSGGFAAHDLGIAGSVAGERLDGRGLMRLDGSTLLAALNDGNGVDRLRQGAVSDDFYFTTAAGEFGVSLTDVLGLDTDLRALNAGNGVRLGVIKITDRTGASAEIDLTQATTIGDVRDAILGSGLAVSATIVNSRLLITDTSPASADPPEGAEEEAEEPLNLPKLKIEDVTGHAAADLGIEGEVDGKSINGRDIYRVATVGDLVRAINYAAGNNGQVTAAIAADGKGITLTASAAAGEVTVRAGFEAAINVTSQAARDLGIEGATFNASTTYASRRLVSGLNTSLLHTLNGGAGTGQLGTVYIGDAAGNDVAVDFGSAETLQDVIDLINAGGNGVRAEINAAGNGIALFDESGGTGPVRIQDEDGAIAEKLGIAGQFEAVETGPVVSRNLQRQYVTRATTLAELGAGETVGTGTIAIALRSGAVHKVNISGSITTVGQLIDQINHVTPDTIEARINDGGDGIVIIDHSTGDERLSIADDTGQVAKALHLSGTAKAGESFINGSQEVRMELGASDTLSRLAGAINSADARFSASVISDGGGTNPYSLTIASTISGARGEMILDAEGVDLGFSTLTRGRDAVASVGTAGGEASILVSSSTNSLKDVIPGVTIDLLAASDEDVTVTTEQDIDAIVESVRGFVDAYNELQGKIDEKTSFNSETFARGTLFGDPTVEQIRQRLQRVISRPFESVSPDFARLSAIGLRVGANNQLEFNEEKFLAAYERSPEIVEELFAAEDIGFGPVLQESLDELTRSFDGVIARKDNLLGDQQELLNDRIDRMSVLLAAKRARLEQQFASLESTLAALQDQQNSLASLSQFGL